MFLCPKSFFAQHKQVMLEPAEQGGPLTLKKAYLFFPERGCLLNRIFRSQGVPGSPD